MNNTGGPAFPSADFEHHEYTGMTLRDYFAAKAMQSLILTYAREIEINRPGFDVCLRAYQIADEMLKEREQK